MNDMPKKEATDVLEEYDFRHGGVGNYARRYAEGTNITVLYPDGHLEIYLDGKFLVVFTFPRNENFAPEG